MKILEKISYNLSNEIIKQCKELNIDEQISLINQSIFEDSKITHTMRLKYQYELLKIAESNKSNFQSAYILNLIAQTNTQLGDLKSALDNLFNAEKKMEKNN